MSKKVLIVEDEFSIQRILQYDLMQSGFFVDLASDGEEGLQKALTIDYDVILLDVMLPKRDGFSVCKELRARNVSTYIVILSARDDELDRVSGLDYGADDYMIKPFSSREVVSKVKAIIRRKEVLSNEKSKSYLGLGKLQLDNSRFEVHVDNKLVDFTLKEYELLEFLIKNNRMIAILTSLCRLIANKKTKTRKKGNNS